jgi:hypothetical protein
MPPTHASQSNSTTAPRLYLALEPSWYSWKLAFTAGPRSKRPDSPVLARPKIPGTLPDHLFSPT